MILHAAVALVVAGALELQPPHRTSFAKFSRTSVEACLRDAHRAPQTLVADARLDRLALSPPSRDRATAALEAIASAPRMANRGRLLLRQTATGLEGEKERTGEAYARRYLRRPSPWRRESPRTARREGDDPPRRRAPLEASPGGAGCRRVADDRGARAELSPRALPDRKRRGSAGSVRPCPSSGGRMRTLKIRPSFNERFARTLSLLGAIAACLHCGGEGATISTISQALTPTPYEVMPV
jgi:hypothetical protein